MKSVSEQLHAMGLGFGDLCEIEGVEGVCVVIIIGPLSQLPRALSRGRRSYDCEQNRVVRGWKQQGNYALPEKYDPLDYEARLFKRIDPPADELPEGVERKIDKAYDEYMRAEIGPDYLKSDRYIVFHKTVARAILQAAKEGKS